MKHKKLKEIPKFKSEDEERKFWGKVDASDYFDWSKPIVNPVMPNLKPTFTSISMRMPQFMIDDLKMIAHRKDMPYQALMKNFIAEKIKEEFAH